MGWLEEKMKKWGAKIDEYAGKDFCNRVLEGCEKLGDCAPDERARWTRSAMATLAELVPDEEIRQKIMLDRSCVFTEEFGEEPLLKLRRIYHDTGSVEAVIEEMCRDTYKYARPYVEGNVIFETKNPRYPEEFAKAVTSEEKRKAYCHCPLAGKGEMPVDETYCYCGAGWYKGIWEFITERSVEIKLVKSVMAGDECCTFAVRLI
jgi:hypothetical protein